MNPPAEAAAPRKPRLALLIATGFGLGYLPVAPGTWGSLGGLIVYIGVFVLTAVACLVFTVGLTAIGYERDSFDFLHSWAAAMPWAYGATLAGVGLLGSRAARRVVDYFMSPDPGPVVIDEISGQLIALIPVSPLVPDVWPDDNLEMAGWKYLLAGFILFRVFDIWKPWPVRQAEKLPGGWGIMADDWVAGVYAALGLSLLRWLGL
jgi:phosphatidylglycerophosphatase A